MDNSHGGLNAYFWFGYSGWGTKCHLIARTLQEKGILQSASGIVFGPSARSFVTKQDEIQYRKLDEFRKIRDKTLSKSVQGEEIESLREKYGSPSLWPFVYADRQLVEHVHPERYRREPYTHDEIVRQVVGAFHYFEGRFEQLDIDVVVTYATASMWALVAYAVASRKGIPYFSLTSTRLPDRVLWNPNPFEQWTTVEDIYRRSVNDRRSITNDNLRKAVRFLESYREKPQDVAYLEEDRQAAKRRAKLKTSDVLGWMSDSLDYFRNRNSDTMVPPPDIRLQQWWKFRRRLGRLRRRKADLYAATDGDEAYVYFPLHLEPEAALMVYAPDYINQISVVEHLARSVPLGFKVYVKEHPAMVGKRPLCEYSRVSKIPNVRLIEPYQTSRSLIRKAEAVVTISGTVGWEATLLRTPVMTLGSVFYSVLPTTRHCRSLNELASDVDKVLSHWEPDDRSLKLFLGSIFEDSFVLPEGYCWSMKRVDELYDNEDAYQRLTNELLRKLAMTGPE